MLKIKLALVLMSSCSFFFTSCSFERKREEKLELTIKEYKVDEKKWKKLKFENLTMMVPFNWSPQINVDNLDSTLVAKINTGCSINSRFNVNRYSETLIDSGDVLENYSSIYYNSVKDNYDKINNYRVYKFNWEEQATVSGFFSVESKGKSVEIYSFLTMKDKYVYDFTFLVDKENTCDKEVFNKVIYNSKLENISLLKSTKPPKSVIQLISDKP
ncbi:hypothetical protein SAMN06298216_1903 [Spirosomataceae bacterium TFI 002]|nr:hypothetical protein SAMN06298216_1903 [Spirosomataceae bacterium TFI 002]